MHDAKTFTKELLNDVHIPSKKDIVSGDTFSVDDDLSPDDNFTTFGSSENITSNGQTFLFCIVSFLLVALGILIFTMFQQRRNNDRQSNGNSGSTVTRELPREDQIVKKFDALPRAMKLKVIDNELAHYTGYCKNKPMVKYDSTIVVPSKEGSTQLNNQCMKITGQNDDNAYVISSQPNCSICLEDYNHFSIVSSNKFCGHVFHHDCIREWLLHERTCPVCRKEILLSSDMEKQLSCLQLLLEKIM